VQPDDAVDAYGSPDAHGGELAPPTVYYHVGPVVIDGPALPVGSVVGLRVLAVVASHESVGEDALDRVPAAALRIRDWAGPWLEPHNSDEPLEIAPHILAAAAAGIVAEGARIDPGGDYSDVARDLARAAIEAVSRRIQPTNDEATAMVLGVLQLDVKKLRDAGDEIVDRLRDHAADGDTALLDAVAVWRGVAHNDWSAHNARKAAT
jgi:hypothetical protein